MTAELINTTTTPDATGFDAFQSDEHRAWRLHRDVCRKIPQEEAGYRGCFALGGYTDNSGCGGWLHFGDRRLLIPDRDFRWVTLIDLPRSRWRGVEGREVHLLSVMKTTMRYGMPTLSPQGVEDSFDFRRMPFSSVTRAGEVVEAGDSLHPETLNSDACPHLFRVGNLLNWAATSTAVHFRSTWACARKAFYKAHGVQFAPDRVHLLFGEDAYDHIERPFGWMPKPYLAFPEEALGQLWDWSTKAGLLSGLRTFTDSFKLAFIADVDEGMPVTSPDDGRVRGVKRGVHFHGMPCNRLVLETRGGLVEIPMLRNANIRVVTGQEVKCGDVLAHDGPKLPDGWEGFCLYKRWETSIPKLLGRQQLENCLHLWFSRQIISIEPGFVHAPAAITSLAALGSAVDDHLWWDVQSSLRYYNSAADAFVFPTVKMAGWDDFRSSLAGDIEYDLTPVSDNFIPRSKTVANDKNKKISKQAKDDAKKNAMHGEKKGNVKPGTKPQADPKKGGKGDKKKGK